MPGSTHVSSSESTIRVRNLLGATWTVGTIAVLAVAYLLVAIPDQQTQRVAGVGLLGIGLLGGVTTIAVFGSWDRVRTLSQVSSLVFTVAGLAVATAMAVDGAFLSDLLLVGAIPVATGVLTAVIANPSRPRQE